jgi:hypothetical protein
MPTLLETAVFVPCCNKKTGSRVLCPQVASLIQTELPATWYDLQQGRNAMNPCITVNSPLIPAVSLYNGLFYTAIGGNWTGFLKMIQSGALRIFVISAGHGIIDIREPIQSYNAKMTGKNAGVWKTNGLDKIIADILVTLRPQRVFGYFAGKPSWPGAEGKYRYFFTEGVKGAVNVNAQFTCAGCFYNLKGQTVSLTCLGCALVSHFQSGFCCQFATYLMNNPLQHGSVTISYDKIV